MDRGKMQTLKLKSNDKIFFETKRPIKILLFVKRKIYNVKKSFVGLFT